MTTPIRTTNPPPVVALGRRQAPLALVLVAMLMVACESRVEVEQRFDVVFPAQGDISALPVTVIDATGGVEEVVIRDGRAVIERDGTVVVDPASPDTVFVTWIGGMCDRATGIHVAGGIEGLRFTEQTDSGQRGCFLAGIIRSLAVRFREPVERATLEIVSRP